MNKTKLFFVWLGSSPPVTVMATISRWRNQPNLDIELITDSFGGNNWVDSNMISGRPWAQVADVVRLSKFEDHSAWYMDVDCEPGRLHLTNFQETTLFRTEPNLLANGIFYLKDNPEFLRCWKSEVLSGLTMKELTVAEATGPGALTRAVYLYSIQKGQLRSRVDLRLASFKLFLHWPAQFNRVLTWFSRYWREGDIATHYANASWADPSETLKTSLTSLVRAALWRVRNSPAGPFFDYTRFLIVSKLPLRERLSRASLCASTRLTSQNLAQVSQLNDLVAYITSQSDLISAVIDLRKAFIKCDEQSGVIALKNGGWEERQLKFLGRVWVRPSLGQILGRVPQHKQPQAENSYHN